MAEIAGNHTVGGAIAPFFFFALVHIIYAIFRNLSAFDIVPNYGVWRFYDSF
jgi:hypothetical protein